MIFYAQLIICYYLCDCCKITAMEGNYWNCENLTVKISIKKILKLNSKWKVWHIGQMCRNLNQHTLVLYKAEKFTIINVPTLD